MPKQKTEWKPMKPPTWGPWIGAPRETYDRCAVEDCTQHGAPHICPYDHAYHHHGCIHYDCDAAAHTKHGLTFRKGWGWVCDEHYDVLLNAARAAREERV